MKTKSKTSIVKIASIRKIESNDRCYDIETENTHNFFANGILVHNSSWSAIYHQKDGIETKLVGGRTLIYKPDSENNYSRNEKNYDVLNKLSFFCRKHNVNLCLRGESYGNGIQRGAHNPHSSLPLSLALFSTYLIDENRYARKGHPFYIFDIAQELGLPTVPLLEKDVPLTPELIHKYDEGMEKINGQFFEGVVVQHAHGSFKIISKAYDAKH